MNPNLFSPKEYTRALDVINDSPPKFIEIQALIPVKKRTIVAIDKWGFPVYKAN